ncbi:T9SS type A sorting domain-containing protein [Chryseobacterium arthrosphaerae]|uniref:T9SS type A sorting domain-containing protein n=1 Tax=Chryseobacterium arthrosphaerae TaxID=651561 RepID=A0A3S0N616_9FLAO|nr:T9SS type A sorting domain-containing protein [Chryseobacterium arthrosphaerae]
MKKNLFTVFPCSCFLSPSFMPNLPFWQPGRMHRQAMVRSLTASVRLLTLTKEPRSGHGRVQQGYEITTLATQETLSEQKDILLYPNPFKDFLYIDFTTYNYKGSEYQLFDAQGKLIRKDIIRESKSELNFSALPSTMYIIRINQNGENIKTFKIIKK